MLAGKQDMTERKAALASMGLVLVDDEPAPEFAMWPCVAQAVALFGDLMTQWRMGFAGPTGLDYSALATLLRLRRVPRDRWGALLTDLQVMEGAALDWFLEQIPTPPRRH